MYESYPSFFWVFGRYVHPVRILSPRLPRGVQMDIVAAAKIGLEMFLSHEAVKAFLPRSREKATNFLRRINDWHDVFMEERADDDLGTIDNVQTFITTLTTTLQDELDRVPMFTVAPKGNLDVHVLCDGTSAAYPRGTLELLNDFVKGDIDHAGRCLAFELPTACGFHILRAVETSLKAFVHAATGTLPRMNQRNWGEYIKILHEKVDAHSDLIDVLVVLKSKRNPLMHPTDNLDTDDAISVLCMCGAGLDAVVADVRRKSLELKFKQSLEALPTL